jgi:hypothetical protein
MALTNNTKILWRKKGVGGGKTDFANLADLLNRQKTLLGVFAFLPTYLQNTFRDIIESLNLFSPTFTGEQRCGSGSKNWDPVLSAPWIWENFFTDSRSRNSNAN